MKKTYFASYGIAMLIIIGMFTSCVTTSTTAPQDVPLTLSKEQLDLLDDAVFEVVVVKPQTDTLAYEKDIEPFMDMIPAWYRNDKYYPVGTAFAISENKLLSALHVFSIGEESMIYKKYFIRDKNQNIYEIGAVTRVHNQKDLIEFELKDKKFSKWLTVAEKYELNTPVVSVGSALGEGIIKRSGLLTSVKKSDFEDLRWDEISFSASATPGNSGGPLLNKEGQVIGIILSKDDEKKLGFALPLSEVNIFPENTAFFASKITFSHLLLQEKLLEKYKYDIKLPKDFYELKNGYKADYANFSEKSMKKLFEKYKDTIFPNGENSIEMLHTNANNTFPEVIFQNKENNKWVLSQTETKKVDLSRNGFLTSGKNGSLAFLYLRRPDNVALKDILDNPKTYMDLLLKGFNDSRKFGNQEIRITSYSKPFKSYEHLDKYGRKWLANYWLIEISDVVVMLFSLPVPTGMLSVIKFASSSELWEYEYDYKILLDFVVAGYYGTFKDWKNFLSLSQYTPAFFKDVKFDYTEDKSVNFQSKTVNISYDTSVFPITDKSDISISMCLFKQNGAVVWGPRKFTFGEDENSKSYFTLRKALSYEDGLSDDFKTEWKNITELKYPYNAKATFDKGLTQITTIPNSYLKLTNAERGKKDYIYTLHLGIEDKLDDADTKAKLDKVNEGIKILD